MKTKSILIGLSALTLLSYSCKKGEEPLKRRSKLEVVQDDPSSSDNTNNQASTPSASSEDKLKDGLIIENNVLIRCREDAIPRDGVVRLPDGITEIGDNAFLSSHNLTSITIPNSVVKIGANAFGSCYFLSNINIGNRVETVGANAFVSSSIQEITLPKSLKEIGVNSLFNTNKLKVVRCKALIPPKIIGLFGEKYSLEVQNSFKLYYDDKRKIKLIVPRGTKKLYEKAPGWKDFSPIVEE